MRAKDLPWDESGKAILPIGKTQWTMVAARMVFQAPFVYLSHDPCLSRGGVDHGREDSRTNPVCQNCGKPAPKQAKVLMALYNLGD